MKVTVNIDCSAAEARAFLGLPDVTPLNDYMVSEIQKRMDSNLALLNPEELMKSWMAFGGMATEQFRKLMATAAAGGVGKP